MKVTIAQLLSSKPALDALGALDTYNAPLAGYRINRLVSRILADFTAADVERSKIFRKLGATVRPNDPEPGLKTLVSIATHQVIRTEPMTPEEIKDPRILANVQVVVPVESTIDFQCEMGTLMAGQTEVDARPLPFELFLDDAGNLITGTERLIGLAGPFVEDVNV